MRGALPIIVVALMLALLAAFFGQAAVAVAIGAPTDNSTILNVPSEDQTQNEIKPPVDYVLKGPTSQSADTPPNFILYFAGATGQDRLRIIGNETWYLNVDINTPGWLYIYEYFPGESLAGKWIAYKWQLSQSGVWSLGPFAPEAGELEGQHIYRVWFYGDAKWATPEPNAPHGNLVYWTYSKDQSAEPMPVQPPVGTPKEESFLDQFRGFMTKPVVLLVTPPLVVIIVILGLYLTGTYPRRPRGQGTTPQPSDSGPEVPSAPAPLTTAKAKIALPNGGEIRVGGDRTTVGRGDLARALSLDQLGLISRRHFEVKFDGEQFFIEDLGSANGTMLNGADISGKGPVTLSDNDIIEPAAEIQLKFCVI